MCYQDFYLNVPIRTKSAPDAAEALEKMTEKVQPQKRRDREENRIQRSIQNSLR